MIGGPKSYMLGDAFTDAKGQQSQSNAVSHGCVPIRVRGDAGTTVKLIPGELLDYAGLVTQKNVGSPVYFTYTARGDGEETWQPRFSYTGFRYVQVEGDVAAVKKLDGQFIHADLPVVGWSVPVTR